MVNHRGKFWQWIAFGFGAGLSPRAPGTAGSVIGVFWALLFRTVCSGAGVDDATLRWVELASIVGFSFFGWHSIKVTEAQTGLHDDQRIVVDEILGQWIALLPFAGVPNAWNLIAGFVLFRLFDILKPWPISWFDRTLVSSFGTLFDDVLAGLAAAGSIWVWTALL